MLFSLKYRNRFSLQTTWIEASSQEQADKVAAAWLKPQDFTLVKVERAVVADESILAQKAVDVAEDANVTRAQDAPVAAPVPPGAPIAPQQAVEPGQQVHKEHGQSCDLNWHAPETKPRCTCMPAPPKPKVDRMAAARAAKAAKAAAKDNAA